MAIRRPKPPLEWTEIRDDDGVVIGRYGVRDGMITVRNRDGWEKTTMASAAKDNNGLARLILSEPPPR